MNVGLITAPRAAWHRRLTHGPGRYLVSLAEQGCASVLNLGLNLWLIREVGAGEYGIFVLWTNVSLILGSLQNALTVCHVLALPPGSPNDHARREPERVLLGVSLLTIAATMAGAVVTVLLTGREAGTVPREIAVFLPAVLLYLYTRALAFSRGTVLVAFLQTASVLGVGVTLFAITYAAGIRPDAGWTLLILACAYGGVGGLGLARMARGLRPSLRPRALGAYLHYLKDSRWVLLGVVSTELLARFYSFIVIGWFGMAALGTLSAAQVLLRPAVLAVTSWGWVARSEMAGRREAGDWDGFLRSLARGLVGTLVISLPWAFLVWRAWPFVSQRLYHGRYAEAGWIALLWGFSAALGGLLGAFSIALQALRAFRQIALVDMAAALVTVAATTTLLACFSYPYAIVGQMAGQAVEIVLLALALHRMRPATRPSLA